MNIGIISDSHDHVDNLNRVLEELRKKKIETLLHAGDICAPFVLPELDALGVPIHLVFGNNDGDQFSLANMCNNELSYCTLHGELAELEFGGLKIAMTHYPAIALPLAHSNQYDIVVYGHTHVVDIQEINDCTLVNPGEVMGRKGEVTYALLDTETKQVEVFEVEK